MGDQPTTNSAEVSTTPLQEDGPKLKAEGEKPSPPARKVRHVPKGKHYDDAQRIDQRLLTFKLTQAERAQRGEHAAKCSVELEQMIADFAQVKKSWTEKIKRIEGAMYRHLDAIAKGQEERAVECQSYRNFDLNRVEFWHKGEMMHARDMTPEDRQESLKLAETEKPAKDNVKSFKSARAKVAAKHVVDHTMTRTEREEMEDGNPVFADNDREIEAVRREETSRRTKRSAVDVSHADPV